MYTHFLCVHACVAIVIGEEITVMLVLTSENVYFIRHAKAQPKPEFELIGRHSLLAVQSVVIGTVSYTLMQHVLRRFLLKLM